MMIIIHLHNLIGHIAIIPPLLFHPCAHTVNWRSWQLANSSVGTSTPDSTTYQALLAKWFRRYSSQPNDVEFKSRLHFFFFFRFLSLLHFFPFFISFPSSFLSLLHFFPFFIFPFLISFPSFLSLLHFFPFFISFPSSSFPSSFLPFFISFPSSFLSLCLLHFFPLHFFPFPFFISFPSTDSV